LNILNELVEKDTLQVTTLFTSSSHSWTQESFGYRPVDTSEPSSDGFLKHQPLAILVNGKFASAYLDKDAPQWPAEPSQEEEEAETEMVAPIEGSAKPATMIAFGCSNMFKNDVLQSITSHKALLLNSVDALTLGEDLINIRSKNIIARRIKETSPIGKAVSKAFVIWFPPIVFIALGIFLTIRRKMK